MKLPDEPSGFIPHDELTDTNHQNIESISHYRQSLLLPGIQINPTRIIYKSILCCGPAIISTIGRRVHFDLNRFDHAFFKSTEGHHKEFFDPYRAERILWIPSILSDPRAEIRLGFSKSTNTYTKYRRVFFWPNEKYLAVISLSQTRSDKSNFITAYTLVGSGSEAAAQRILSSPKP